MTGDIAEQTVLDAHTDEVVVDNESTELAVIQQVNIVTTFTKEGGAKHILDKIKEEVEKIDLDVSTVKGRAQIKSLAHKIARSKTALDQAGKDLKAEMQKQVDLVDGERKTIRDELDKLKEKVRQPLTDYENKEKERVRVREDRIEILHNLRVPLIANATVETIDAHLAQLAEMENYDWQEFEMRAKATADKSREHLEAMRKDRILRDEQEAKIIQYEKEKAEAERKEREEQIAAEAAERAKREAEEKAEIERKAAEERETAQRLAKEEAERKALEEKARAEKAEADRIASEEKAKADAIAAAEKAEIEKQQAAERAAQEERDRAAAAKAAEDKAAAARAADLEHRGKINREARAGLEKIMNEYAGEPLIELATTIIKAIAKGEIPHVTIEY